MYYPSSENKGADQLRGYREADLRLCFRLCRLLVFPRGGSFSSVSIYRMFLCHIFDVLSQIRISYVSYMCRVMMKPVLSDAAHTQFLGTV